MSTSRDQIIINASAHRQTLTFPFIAITGSNGKTTTKKMLAAILQAAGRVYDFDYHSDIPSTIAMEMLQLKNKYDWALVKLGAAESEAVRISAELIKPTIGIITNVGEAHLRQHGSIEKIAREKQYLLERILPDGIAIVNRDNEYTRAMGEAFDGKVVSFGLSELSDYYATHLDHLGPDGTALTICRNVGPSLRLHLPIFSLGDVYNVLAAIAAACYCNVADEQIVNALENNFCIPDGRGVLHLCKGDIRILDDTYDATPQSLMKSTKSLLNFREYSNRLILIMGDMADLGKQNLTMHTMMGHYLAGMPIDIILLIGKSVRHTAKAIRAYSVEKKNIKAFSDIATAEKWLLSQLRDKDTVLIEGSEKEELSCLVKSLTEQLQTTNGS